MTALPCLRCAYQLGNKTVFGPGDAGAPLVSPELRSKSRNLLLLGCCALPSDIKTFPRLRCTLSVHAGVCVPLLKFVPRATAPTLP